MALQGVPGRSIIPPFPPGIAFGPSFGTLTLDAINEKASGVFYAPDTKTISHLLWRSGTVTTGATLQIRLETVDLATGDPTGTLKGTTSNASHVLDAANDNVLHEIALTTPCAVTEGDLLALVVTEPGASAGNFTVNTFTDDNRYSSYCSHFTASWAKSASGFMGGVKYDDGTYAFIEGFYPFGSGSSLNPITFASNSTPDERALKWKLPYPGRLRSCWLWCDADGDFQMVLYNEAGSVVATSPTMDLTVRGANQQGLHVVPFTVPFEFAKDTFYYLAIKPTTTTALISNEFNVNSAAHMDMFDGGQNFHSATRVDAGAWTAVPTTRPFIGLILDAFDDGTGGAGGGGMIVHPGMSGRLSA